MVSASSHDSDTANGSFVKEEGKPAARGLSSAAESTCYRSGLMDFSPSGERLQEDTQPERQYSAEELAEAVDDARRAAALETETAMRAAFASDIEKRRCDLLAAIKNQLESQQALFDEALNDFACASQDLALALAKAVIPRAIEMQPLVDIREAVKAVLARLANEPTIEARLPASLAEKEGMLFANLAKEVGFTGEFVTVADSTLSPGDIKLRWAGGAIDRRIDSLQAEALNLADRWFEHQPKASSEVNVATCAPSQPNVSGELSD